MPDTCEFCGRESLSFAYAPERSTRGISVYICPCCGLVQSLPRRDHAPRSAPAVSSGADWGNVRYGKGFRTKIALDAVLRHKAQTPFTLLDVGSNRGRFVAALHDAVPAATITAVEPDERVADSVAGKAALHACRIEATHFADASFDVVHSCHTIEHLAHPLQTLRDHHRVLKEGGLLILDAPNIALIGSDDVVEEWFIDKHLTHFSERTLTRMVERAGFELVEKPDAKDRENLFLVARKAATPAAADPADPAEVDAAYALLSSYAALRAHNLAALHAMAEELTALAPQGVAIWGAGRIFDSLVVHGGFDPKSLCLLIDTYLKAHVAERHGVPLSGPEALAEAAPAVVAVMSRGFAAEIASEAKQRVPSAKILLFTDLISRARLKLAA
jgi:ubiquinone/menaquinone biosynthesis C-methylase UbiE